MPMYDKQCNRCEAVMEDILEPITAELTTICPCGGEMRRKLIPGRRTAGVVPDSIPGGIMIAHGICNDDGSPRRYDSKSEMKKEAAIRNMVNRVEHVGLRGSDRNPHTSRWV